ADDQLEHVEQARIVGVELRERTELLRQQRDERRLDEVWLNLLREDLVRDLEFLPRRIDAQSHGFRAGDLFRLWQFEPVVRAGGFTNELLIRHLAPLAGEVDLLAA